MSFDRRNGRQHSLMGVNLSSSRRNTALVLLAGSLLSVVLLTARYHLAHPDDHPFGTAGKSIGVQSFAQSFHFAVKPTTATGSDKAVEGEGEAGGGATGDDEYDDFDALGTDWLDDPQDWLSAIVANKWDPLANNSRPLTELTIKSCVLPPGLYDLCAPISSKKEDALRGKWVRVDKDINRRIGIYYLYVFERRLLPNSQAPVITNITLLTHAPTGADLASTESDIWVEVSESIRTGSWPRMAPMFLHYRLTDQAAVRAARRASASANAGDLEPITEIDVVYGGAQVRPMWDYELMDTYISGGADDAEAVNLLTGKGERFGARLAVRRTSSAVPQAHTLRFSQDGKYTILQVADLHFSVGPGQCRDLDPERERACKKLGADAYTLEWLLAAVAESKPDLIVFSGDQLNGQDTSWDSTSSILKFAPAIWDLKLPWTVIFGNHDDEKTDLTREGQMELMSHMPYFVGEQGPGVGGTGNYMRSIRSADSSDTTLFNLYFLDSHANVKSLNPWGEKGYDFIKPGQVNWFKGKSSLVTTLRRPYSAPAGSSTSSSAYVRPSRRPSRPKKPSTSTSTSTSTSSSDDGEADFDTTKADVAAFLRKPKLKPHPDTIDFSSPSSNADEDRRMAKKVKRQYEQASDEEEGATEGDFASEEDDESVGKTAAAGAFDAPVYGDDEEGETSGKSSGAASGYDGYSNGASKSDEEGTTTPNGDELEVAEPVTALDPFDMEGDGEPYDSTPTVLPAGPTRAKPMDAKPNAMLFFHIPLVESYSSPIDVGADGKHLLVGERFEGSGASKTNSGMFETGILHQGELLQGEAEVKDEFWEGEFSAPTAGRPEVKVVANGHCHVSEDCRRVNGVWLCFGGGGSYSGYGKAGFARRMRVYSISEFGERVATHHLLDTLQRDHEIVLVGEDAMGTAAKRR